MIKGSLFQPKTLKCDTYIHRQLSAESAIDIIESNAYGFVAPWLIRESSITGLLTISYFNTIQNKIYHRRIYFNGNQWEHASSNYDEASAIAEKCTQMSKQTLTESGGELLAKYLSDNSYSIENLIWPTAEKASENTVYAAYALTDANQIKAYLE